MKQYLPFLDWMVNYKRENFSGDLSAGLTVGVMLIPQGMAYSMLAGLPPIYGLYAVTIPLLIYAFLGTSRQLAVGPVAMISLLIASGVGAMTTIGSAEYIGLAILLAFMVGMIQFLMGVFRLGFLVNFLAHPVIAGFTSAAAIIIAVSQFKHVFGLNIARGKVHETLIEILRQSDSINLPTILIGILTIAVLMVFKKINKKIPAPLIVVLLSMLAVYYFNLEAQGVKILKEVPAGLPAFSIPNFNLNSFKSLMPIALTISFVGFMESIAVSKAIQNKKKDYRLDPNQELRALGLANIFGSFFKSFPVTGGFSRTAVNEQAGANTGLASAISALLIIITLLFLTPYFYFLPNASLAGIIIVAVFGLLDFKECKHLWKADKKDFGLFIVTAVVTLLVGIEEGILTGVTLSIIMLVFSASRPHVAQLGEIDDSGFFKSIDRFPRAKHYVDILIIRIDAQVFFANTNYLKEYIDEHSVGKGTIIVHCGSIQHLDSSAVHALGDWVQEYKLKNVRIIFTNVIGPVRDIIIKNGLHNIIGRDNFFLDVKHAMRNIKGTAETHNMREMVFQTNSTY